MSRVLGVDPGLSGGAALRVDGEVTCVWAWTPVRAGIRLRSTAGESVVATLAEVGARLRAEAGALDAVVLEGLEPPGWHAGRRPGRYAVECLIVLAEAAGEMLGALRGPSVVRPLPAEWRRQALGLPPSVVGDRAEGFAIALAAREGWLPRWTAREQGAVAEAGAMATCAPPREC